MRRWVAIGLLLTALAGCTPARQTPAGQIRSDTAENGVRLVRVVTALARANVELCRDSAVGVMTPPAGGPEICALSVMVIDRKEVNAVTDGMNIALTKPMMAFVQSDDELAFIIGHELGHILRKHVQERQAAGMVGNLIGSLVLAGPLFQTVAERAFSPDREREADRWGLFMAARAGYRAEAAPAFWERMPVRNAGFLPTHPATPDRIDGLKCLSAEIVFRQAGGLPLDPASELKASEWRC